MCYLMYSLLCSSITICEGGVEGVDGGGQTRYAVGICWAVSEHYSFCNSKINFIIVFYLLV